MKTLMLMIELTYNDQVMHGDIPEGVAWFYRDVLGDDGLTLHSDEVGDEVGSVKVLEVIDDGGQ